MKSRLLLTSPSEQTTKFRPSTDLGKVLALVVKHFNTVTRQQFPCDFLASWPRPRMGTDFKELSQSSVQDGINSVPRCVCTARSFSQNTFRVHIRKQSISGKTRQSSVKATCYALQGEEETQLCHSPAPCLCTTTPTECAPRKLMTLCSHVSSLAVLRHT